MKVMEVEAEVEDVGGLKLEEGKEEGRQGREEESRRSSRKGSRLECRARCRDVRGLRCESPARCQGPGARWQHSRCTVDGRIYMRRSF